MHPSGRDEDERPRLELEPEHDPPFIKLVLRVPFGEVFDAEVSLSVLEHEPEVIFHAIVRDITERKKLDKKVRCDCEPVVGGWC